MDQTIINWVLGIFGSIVGFVVRALWQGLKDLRAADKELVDKIHNIDKLVAGDYVKRDKLDACIATISLKLDRIESKLDRKVDK